MSDVPIQKIKVVIEVELRERVSSFPAVPDPGADAQEKEYEQALFAMLEADPKRYAEFIKILAISSIESYGIHRMIAGLAQIHDTHTASMQVFANLLPRFSPPAQAYLQQVIQEGWIMDGPDSLFNRVQAEPVGLTSRISNATFLESIRIG